MLARWSAGLTVEGLRGYGILMVEQLVGERGIDIRQIKDQR